MWMYRSVTVGLLALASAGCGPELLGGAQIETTATSDETDEAAAQPARQTDWLPPTETLAADASAVEGELLVSARVALVSSAGQSFPLGEVTATPARFRIEGDDEALIARGDVAPGEYAAVRITFTRIEATVESGVEVDGVPLLGSVAVALAPGGSVVVERALSFTAEPRLTHEIVVDLNAHSWLPSTQLPSRTVDPAVFAAAVEVRAR